MSDEVRRSAPRPRHFLVEPGNLLIYQQRERALVACLRRAGVNEATLPQLRVLEVGCGSGGLLPLLIYYGASPPLVHGVDLDAIRIQAATKRYPAIGFSVGDVTRLPFQAGTWDVVVQSTMFTSILEPQARRAAAREMMRVLTPHGFILWFDFRYNSPHNNHVRRVTKGELLRDLFPDAHVYLLRTVLLPPLARLIAPVSWTLAELLAVIPPLCSHYCALIRPKERAAESGD